MKKSIITSVIAIAIAVVTTSCANVSEKKFYACEVDSVQVLNGTGEETSISVRGVFCHWEDTANVINSLFLTENEYAYLFKSACIDAQYVCNYPRTFVPTCCRFGSISDKVTDNGDVKGSMDVYGYCKNGFGVECDINTEVYFVISRNDAGSMRVTTTTDRKKWSEM